MSSSSTATGSGGGPELSVLPGQIVGTTAQDKASHNRIIIKAEDVKQPKKLKNVVQDGVHSNGELFLG